MSGLFVNNGRLSEGESRDGARFSSTVSAASLSEGEAACYGTVSVPGTFIPLKFGDKEPRWRVAPTDSNKCLIRSALPSKPSVEAAAGDGALSGGVGTCWRLTRVRVRFGTLTCGGVMCSWRAVIRFL